MLRLTQAYTSSETPSGRDYVTVTLARNGEKALSYYRSAESCVADLPKNVFTLSSVKCGEILGPTISYTSAEMVSQKRLVVAVAGSPCMDKVAVASVYQNYSNADDPRNAFGTDGAVNGLTHDVTLEIVSFCGEKKQQAIIRGVVLSPLIFYVRWQKKSSLIVMYATKVTNGAATFSLEVRRSKGLSLMASTNEYPIYSNTFSVFSLEQRVYVVGSGAAIGGTVHEAQVPSGINISEVCFADKSIRNVAFHATEAPPQWFDVKVCGNEAFVINGTLQPINGYYVTTSEGVVDPLYDGCDDSSFQLLRFCGGEIVIVDELRLNLQSDYGVSFVPRSNKVIVTTRYSSENTYGQMMVYEACSGRLVLREASHAVAVKCHVSFSSNGKIMVASGLASDVTGINSVQVFLVGE